jgi:glycine/D-amino acid oxidase-like deaminating enzyme
MPVAATVQPARLALGLRRRLLERGVRIFERSPVVRFTAGPPVVAETAGGRVRAGRGILALNAWTASLPRFRRRLVSWGSYIVLTAPAPERLREIGWTGGECITDFRHALHYFRTTADGRVAFGGGGGRVGLHPRIGPWYDYDERSVRRAAEGLRHLLPALADVPIEEAWGGPIDVSPVHLPFFGSLAPGTVHYGVGYSGNGVAPSHLAGRVLSTLALGRDDPVLGLPLVNAEPRRFPPEPLRTAGAHMVREAVVRWERAQDAGRKPSPLVRLVARSPRKLGYRIGPH